MNRIIQFYNDEQYCRIFVGKEVIADIRSEKMLDATGAKKILKMLGYKLGRATKTDWGFEVDLQEIK